MSREDFLAHLGHIDVLLDPLHFGSGNTLYEAMAMGTPIVTCPGAFARGRIVAGAYAQMGVADPPVASSPKDYAALALALAGDPARRARLRADLRAAAADALFGDLEAVRELEAFLTAAVEAAGRGERLASGWRPARPEAVR
jgi:predicted O-linked N-acetylglucosamine transferase (SPINDLY family)